MKRESRKKRRNRVIRNWICLLLAAAALIILIVIGINVLVNAIKGPEKKEHPFPGGAETETKETYTGDPNDVTAPKITGDANIYVAKGSKVKYKSYVFIEDDSDPYPKLDIDNSNVNLNEEGIYKVIYTATDASGNSTSKTVNVVVGAEDEPNVDESIIYDKADEVLAKIITPHMTDLEKVFAVFYYVRDTFTYVKDENYWEYKQEAYHMMTTLQDNCYANVCVSRLLLERLGFESFMIQGDLGYVDERHYWNMVSIDGGESWYHYDAAWWTWMDDEYPLCMMTDEFAQKISDAHDGLWNYDRSKYPATPKEMLWSPEELGVKSKFVN